MPRILIQQLPDLVTMKSSKIIQISIQKVVYSLQLFLYSLYYIKMLTNYYRDIPGPGAYDPYWINEAKLAKKSEKCSRYCTDVYVAFSFRGWKEKIKTYLTYQDHVYRTINNLAYYDPSIIRPKSHRNNWKQDWSWPFCLFFSSGNWLFI